MSLIGVVIPCQHQFNDETLCEAGRNAIVEATKGEAMTRDYPGSADSWECLAIADCPNKCLDFPKEYQHMEELAIEAAKQLVEDRGR